jgi:hypothetical protein
MEDSVLYTWPALAAVWMLIFGVFAAIASGTMTGINLGLLMLVGLAGPAIILALDEKRRKAAILK